MFYTPDGDYLNTIELNLKMKDFKICPQGGFILSNSGIDKTTAGIYYVNAQGKEENYWSVGKTTI